MFTYQTPFIKEILLLNNKLYDTDLFVNSDY